MKSFVWPGITFSMPDQPIDQRSILQVGIFSTSHHNLSTPFHPKYSPCSCNPKHICIANNQTPSPMEPIEGWWWNSTKSSVAKPSFFTTDLIFDGGVEWWWFTFVWTNLSSFNLGCIQPLRINCQNHVHSCLTEKYIMGALQWKTAFNTFLHRVVDLWWLFWMFNKFWVCWWYLVVTH